MLVHPLIEQEHWDALQQYLVP